MTRVQSPSSHLWPSSLTMLLFVRFLSKVIPPLFAQVSHSLFRQESFSYHPHPSMCHAFCETHVSVKKTCENISKVKCSTYSNTNIIHHKIDRNFFSFGPISLRMVSKDSSESSDSDYIGDCCVWTSGLEVIVNFVGSEFKCGAYLNTNIITRD